MTSGRVWASWSRASANDPADIVEKPSFSTSSVMAARLWAWSSTISPTGIVSSAFRCSQWELDFQAGSRAPRAAASHLDGSAVTFHDATRHVETALRAVSAVRRERLVRAVEDRCRHPRPRARDQEDRLPSAGGHGHAHFPTVRKCFHDGHEDVNQRLLDRISIAFHQDRRIGQAEGNLHSCPAAIRVEEPVEVTGGSDEIKPLACFLGDPSLAQEALQHLLELPNFRTDDIHVTLLTNGRIRAGLVRDGSTQKLQIEDHRVERSPNIVGGYQRHAGQRA